MQHIHQSEILGLDFDNYFSYLPTVQDKFTHSAYQFASNPHHYDLSSHLSLHDAWLESFTVSEVATGERKQIRNIEITLCFLGPFHDFKFYLKYSSVSSYQSTFGHPESTNIPIPTSHGDLLIHEMRISNQGHQEHELLFSSGSTIVIAFGEFSHIVEPYTYA
jgi:hypothetical protein